MAPAAALAASAALRLSKAQRRAMDHSDELTLLTAQESKCGKAHTGHGCGERLRVEGGVKFYDKDHITAVADWDRALAAGLVTGDVNDLENQQLLCTACHRKKTTREAGERAKVRAAETAEAARARRAGAAAAAEEKEEEGEAVEEEEDGTEPGAKRTRR